MINKSFASCDANQAAAEVIDRNVSFDFQAFLGRVGPAPSRVVLHRESNQRFLAESEQAQDNFQNRPQSGQG